MTLDRRPIVRMLLDRGADPNATEPYDENVLHHAIGGSKANVEVIDLLLQHGARPDYLLGTSETVFHALSGSSLDRAGREQVEQLLQAHGVTRQGLFHSLGLDRIYDSPEEAFGP